MEKTENKPNESPSRYYKSKLIWVMAFIILAVLGSASWWGPRLFPTIFQAIIHEKEQTVVVAPLQPQLDLDTLKQETTLLKSEVTALREQLHIASQMLPIAQQTTIPLLTAFLDLKIAIRFGIPYEKELSRLKKLTAENTLPLDDYSTFGIPLLSYLVNEFKSCLENLMFYSSTQSKLTLWEKLKITLRSLITIKKIKPGDNNLSDPWELNPIFVLIKQGDIATALMQLNQKNLPENKSLQTWKIHAEAYVHVEQKLEELMQKLFMNEHK